jgi:hypothetical protein
MTNPTLKIGDGNWAYKEDNLLGYAVSPVNNKFLPREMTFTRASDGARVNEDGLVENMPFNLLQYSQDLTNVVWAQYVYGGASLTRTGSQTDPFGGSNAQKLDIVVGTGGVLLTQNFTAVSSVDYTLSVWLKGAVGGEKVFICLKDTGSNGPTGPTWTLTTDWVRYEATITNDTGTSRGFQFRITTAQLPSGGTIYAYGAQAVLGSTAKPYFPTTNRQDVPRIDYSSGTGALLLEPQRTNLATYSQTFDNAAWIAQDISTPTPNTAISPDGYTNAYTIEKAGGSGASGYFYTYRRITSNTTNTFSIFAKYKEGSGIIWLLGKNSATFAYFNLKTGTAPSASAGMTTKIENYGNGWYKCSFTQDYTSATQYTIGVGLCLVDGTPYYNPTSAATQGIYIWGAQFEAGSYPTSYIPTTSSSVTRLADSSYRDVNNILPSANTFTWFVQFVVPEFVGYAAGDFFAKDTGGANDLRIYANNNGIVRFRVDPLGQNYDVSASVGDLAKCIMKCDSGIVSVFYNGQKKYTFSATTIDFYKMQFGQPSASPKIQSSILYPTAISDDECIALTT